MRIALLSIPPKKLKEFEADDERVVAPLLKLGHMATFVPWQKPGVDWRRYDGVVIRTTWDYQDNLDAFLGVLREIESQTRLANPLKIVKWNADKKIYLRDLEARGATIVPTIWKQGRISSRGLEQWFDQLHADEIVIKPTVGANAQDALRLKRGEADAAALSKLFAGRSFMVQPFMRRIMTEGEFSLFYINGVYSHAIRKTPARGDFRVQEEHGGIIKAIKPPPSVLAAGKRILQYISAPLLYARVDFVRITKDKFALMELELIEPSLYLRKAKHAPRMFAEAIYNWFAPATVTKIRRTLMPIKTGKRELINTGTDKRYVKRNKDGTFKESVDVGRSLAADRRSRSKTVAKPGYGDQGDLRKRGAKKAAKKSVVP